MNQQISPQKVTPFITAGLAFIVYLLTMPTDLTSGIFGTDSGELITASFTYGIPHPTGYPTWLLTSRAFAFLPVGQTIAHRYNLFSALCMVSALGLLVWSSHKVSPKLHWSAPMAAGLTAAFSLTVWSQAVITEVYALNSLMISIVIALLATAYHEDELPSRTVLLLGLACGVAVTTHLTSVFLLPMVGLIMLRHWQKIPWAAVGFGLGLTPFLLLFWRAGSSSPVVWGDTSTISGFWWLVSGAIYRANATSIEAVEIWNRIRPFFSLIPLDPSLLVPIGGLLGMFTLGQQVKHKSKLLFPAGLLLTAAIYTGYALNYNTSDWRVFLLPANLCLVIPLSCLLGLFRNSGFLLPMLMLVANFQSLSHFQADDTRVQWEMIETDAPDGAILISDGRDRTIFPLWYFRFAEKLRPDLIIVDFNLFQFDWYRNRLQRDFPNLTTLEEDNLPQFKEQNSDRHPICEVSLHPFALACTDG